MRSGFLFFWEAGIDRQQHTALSKAAGDFVRIDKELFAARNRVERFTEMGWPSKLEVLSDEYLAGLRRFRDAQYREIEKLMRQTVFADWADEYTGIGLRSVGLVTGLLPYAGDIDPLSATWKLLGLHVGGDGTAPRREKGKRPGYDPMLRAFALRRVGEPAIRTAPRSTAYRTVYDARRDHTRQTHPPMLDEDGDLADPDCEGCVEAVERTKKKRASKRNTRKRKAPAMDCGNVRSNAEGSHWTDGHRHADALRVTAKAIFRDWWRVFHGQPPRVGQRSGDTHASIADREAVHA